MMALYLKLTPQDVSKLYYSRNPDTYIKYFDQLGGHGGDYYTGLYTQRGYGFLGDLFSKGVFPMLRSIGHALLPMAFSSGSEVLSDLSKGESLGSSVKRRGLSLAKAAVTKAVTGAGKKRKANNDNLGEEPAKKKKKTAKDFEFFKT